MTDFEFILVVFALLFYFDFIPNILPSVEVQYKQTKPSPLVSACGPDAPQDRSDLTASSTLRRFKLEGTSEKQTHLGSVTVGSGIVHLRKRKHEYLCFQRFHAGSQSPGAGNYFSKYS